MLLLLCLPLCVPPAPLQQSRTEMARGDLVNGRPVRTFERAVIGDDGSWNVVALLDSIVHGENGVHLRDGSVLSAEGEFLASLGARPLFLGVLEGSGANVTQNALITGYSPPRPYGRTEAVLNRGREILTEHEPVQVQGLPSSLRVREIGSTAANGSGTVLSVVRLDTQRPHLALLRFEFDAGGAPLARTLELHEDDVLPDGSLVAFLRDPKLDEQGNWLVGVDTDDGRTLLMTRNRILLATAAPSPLAGRTLLVISDQYDNNDLGGYAVSVRVDGGPATDTLLLQNGAVLAQEGELLPSLSPAVPRPMLAEVGQVRLGNSGDVYWHARTGKAALTEGLFMREREAILQAGVSRIEGKLVLGFEEDLDNFELSPSGRFWIARVRLESTGKALVTADFGASRVLPGCARNPATLRHTEGLVLAGRTVRLVLDGPARPGSLATIHLATGLAQPGQPCGLPTPIGEVLLDPAQVVTSFAAGLFAGAPVALDLAIPADLALVNRTVYLQGAFLRPGVLLSNALSLEIGAP